MEYPEYLLKFKSMGYYCVSTIKEPSYAMVQGFASRPDGDLFPEFTFFVDCSDFKRMNTLIFYLNNQVRALTTFYDEDEDTPWEGGVDAERKAANENIRVRNPYVGHASGHEHGLPCPVGGAGQSDGSTDVLSSRGLSCYHFGF